MYVARLQPRPFTCPTYYMPRPFQVTALTEKTNNARINALRRWYTMGGVLVIGLTMFSNLALMKNLKKKRDQNDVAKFLLDPGADFVVCDEGHVLRQEKSNLSIAVCKIRTLRRIVLTGTPLQNNLLECELEAWLLERGCGLVRVGIHLVLNLLIHPQ